MTPTPSSAPSFVPTREHALSVLEGFVPHAGRTYSTRRNYDLGSGNHTGVSQLSPYLRLRLITEEEVIKTVLARHSASETEKYVQEVFWRGYFKGWLEHRPDVWYSYLDDVAGYGAISHQAWPAPLTMRWAEKRELFALMRGRMSFLQPATCTTMRGCGSPRSGFLRCACLGNWAPISFCATC